MKTIFLGVGHGGSDPGAVKENWQEKDVNLDIALACREELKQYPVKVILSRETDEDDPLSDEIRECNAAKADLAVDIHNNAGGGDGAEAYYHVGGGTGKTLAENILSEIVLIGQNSRGAKVKTNSQGKDYYGFIRETLCPAVIVECAFLDNAADRAILDTPEKRKRMGQAIARGIVRTLGLTVAEPVTEAEATPSPPKEDAALQETPVKKEWRQALIRLLTRLVEWLLGFFLKKQ